MLDGLTAPPALPALAGLADRPIALPGAGLGGEPAAGGFAAQLARRSQDLAGTVAATTPGLGGSGAAMPSTASGSGATTPARLAAWPGATGARGLAGGPDAAGLPGAAGSPPAELSTAANDSTTIATADAIALPAGTTGLPTDASPPTGWPRALPPTAPTGQLGPVSSRDPAGMPAAGTAEAMDATPVARSPASSAGFTGEVPAAGSPPRAPIGIPASLRAAVPAAQPAAIPADGPSRPADPTLAALPTEATPSPDLRAPTPSAAADPSDDTPPTPAPDAASLAAWVAAWAPPPAPAPVAASAGAQAIPLDVARSIGSAPPTAGVATTTTAATTSSTAFAALPGRAEATDPGRATAVDADDDAGDPVAAGVDTGPAATATTPTATASDPTSVPPPAGAALAALNTSPARPLPASSAPGAARPEPRARVEAAATGPLPVAGGAAPSADDRAAAQAARGGKVTAASPQPATDGPVGPDGAGARAEGAERRPDAFSHWLDGALPAPSAVPAGSAQAAATHRTEVPMVTMPTPVTAPEFRDSLGVQVSMLARDGIQQAELHLNPTDMGPISVRIEIDGTQAQVSFGVDHAATRAIVEAGLPELASALRDAGLTLTGGGVSDHASGPGGDAAQGGARQGATPQDRPDGRRGGPGSGDPPEPAVPVPRRVHLPGGVDLYA